MIEPSSRARGLPVRRGAGPIGRAGRVQSGSCASSASFRTQQSCFSASASAQSWSRAVTSAAVRQRTLAGEAIYELDQAALAELEPELIVTQALCPVCAVSYEEVAALALELPSRPRVVALDPQTLEESFGDVRTLAEATGREAAGAALVRGARERIDRVTAAVG